ncbi:MAG: hypothetical protein PHF44_04405 [Candidatus Pacebacteria bacterium]|nr:hypothetical protein [Candidatus Paceibacterota bacterium]
MKNTSSTIFTLIIGGVCIYFFYQLNFFIGILLFIWLISRLFGHNLIMLFEGVNNSEIGRKSNIEIELWFNIAEILNHKIFEDIFEKIKKNNENEVVSFKETKEWEKKLKNGDIAKIKEEWKNKLIENYKKKYNNSIDFTSDNVRYIWEKVKFNIKNNILWKDGKIFFNDFLVHEVSIPYEYNNEGEEDYSFLQFPAEVNIKIFVVNGIIKLQVGNFDKFSTPKFLRKEGLAIYQTNFTIATFPLMYAHYGIPNNYLNPCFQATDSYWEFMSGKLDKDVDWRKDWKRINKEMQDYEYISNQFANGKFNINNSKTTKIGVGFAKKLLEWRKVNKDFKSNEDKTDDEGYVPDFLKDDHTEYTNKYLHISLFDYNMAKENKAKYTFSDYWEEHP